MAENPLSAATAPAFRDVVRALDDPDCREILKHLDEPRSAAELTDRTGIPRSTVYEKLDLLDDAGLVREFTEIRRDGSHTANYECSFGELRVWLDDDREFCASIERANRAPDERLAALWTEVRTET
ncbi:MAG: helix-turn-helix domain-containing protein [Haloferacaceae archaeon]